jgi:hypothetical protein
MLCAASYDFIPKPLKCFFRAYISAFTHRARPFAGLAANNAKFGFVLYKGKIFTHRRPRRGHYGLILIATV